MNHNSKKSAAMLPLVRCAVYTRKSTEEGLEQEFNSLDAQRESAEAFVRSHRNLDPLDRSCVHTSLSKPLKDKPTSKTN